MHTFTASEAKTWFGELLDRIQHEPVCVTGPGSHDRRDGQRRGL